MIIDLYYNSSDNNRMDKSLSSVMSLTGTLKSECSVTDPVILIEANNLSGVNYMYIPDFSRYYYINGILSVKNGLWALSGHVDVLMSYRAAIRKLGAVIARQQNINCANLYLDDDRLLITSKRDFVLKTFPNKLNAPGTSGNSFVLTVAGGRNESS